MRVTIGRNGRDLSNLRRRRHFLRVCKQEFHDAANGRLGPPKEVHGVTLGSDVLDALGINGTRQHRYRPRPIAHNFIRCLGPVLNEIASV